jgi:hypothetical protein
MMMKETNERSRKRQLPIGKNEDVDYDAEFADEDDVEAVERAHAADARQEKAAGASEVVPQNS